MANFQILDRRLVASASARNSLRRDQLLNKCSDMEQSLGNRTGWSFQDSQLCCLRRAIAAECCGQPEKWAEIEMLKSTGRGPAFEVD